MLGDRVSRHREDDVHEVVLRLLQLSDECRPAVQIVRCSLHEVVQLLHLVIHRLVAVVKHGQRVTVCQLKNNAMRIFPLVTLEK